MKKLMILCSAFLLVAGFTLPAMATPVYFDVADAPDSKAEFTFYQEGVEIGPFDTFWGSVGPWTFGDGSTLTASLDENLDSQQFTLEDNDSFSFDFIDFTTTGSGIGFFEIDATLAFDVPDIESNFEGGGGWGSVNWDIFSWSGTVSGGVLNWDDPVTYLTLDTGNQIMIELEQGWTIQLGNATSLQATVTNLGGAAPVPEPATMLLLGTGLVGLAGVGRKKFFKKQ